MSEFGLVEPFGVDHGELDGLTPAQCFALGVEWEMFRRLLEKTVGECSDGTTSFKTAYAFSTMCNERNADRLLAMAERHGRFCESRTKHDGWTELIVGGLKDG